MDIGYNITILLVCVIIASALVASFYCAKRCVKCCGGEGESATTATTDTTA
ncbi:hypothetical protein ARALYDRAFT_902557 [Arabidopsis lyrata subsp. lyrata]|uniref:Uncharacterized protein n=1 Tax=Arabidopsis lyrata subsp. lyrata TaxID=81972 RepID=D7LH36_ARALL|nr:hypothetical protein ARALYDRAFT_902557 [Arabidopsis lyrata subsp. lyrata]